jgi:hypothetical protein
VDSDMAQWLPELLGRLCEKLRPFLGESVGALLYDPQTDVAVLEKIKEFGKAVAEAAPSEAEHDAAIAVYYGAIASALVHHRQRITSFSYESLRESFESLVENPWLTAELIDLLRNAQEACLAQSGEPKPKG